MGGDCRSQISTAAAVVLAGLRVKGDYQDCQEQQDADLVEQRTPLAQEVPSAQVTGYAQQK